MTALMLIALLGAAVLTGLAMAAGMVLAGHLAGQHRTLPPPTTRLIEALPQSGATARIELAALRSRIVRLEAIVAGFDL